jgi:anti-sigma B factor antagonist
VFPDACRLSGAALGALADDQLAIEVERAPHAIVVRLTGELDLAVAGQLRSTLAAARPSGRLLLLDLQGLTFMDCAGIAVLVQEQRRAQADGYSVAVTGARGEVAELLALTGLDAQLRFDDGRPAPAPPGLS